MPYSSVSCMTSLSSWVVKARGDEGSVCMKPFSCFIINFDGHFCVFICLSVIQSHFPLGMVLTRRTTIAACITIILPPCLALPAFVSLLVTVHGAERSFISSARHTIMKPRRFSLLLRYTSVGLSEGENSLRISLLVSIDHTNVTDGWRTDWHRGRTMPKKFTKRIKSSATIFEKMPTVVYAQKND